MPFVWLMLVETVFLAVTAHAAIFVDNVSNGCSSPSDNDYNPATRSCGSGSDTVYTSLRNANSGAPEGSSSSLTVINVRSGNYYETLDLYRSYVIWRKYPADTSRPVIDGQNVRPGQDGALIYGHSVTGVTVDGIRFQNAAFLSDRDGDGQEDDISYTGANALRFDYPNSITIQNCYMTNIGSAAVMLIYDGANNIVQDNYMEQCNLEISQSLWSGAINFHCNVDSSVARRNTIYRCRGEGIQFTTNQWYGSSDNNTAEYNTIVDNPRVAIYICGTANNVVRHNLIYHTHSSGSEDGGPFGNLGIIFASENNVYYDSHHSEVYGNLVAGTSVALMFGYDDRSPEFKVRDSVFYNNTFFESIRDPGDWGSVPTLISFHGGDVIGANVNIRNNILWQTTGTLNDDPGYGAVYSNNLYSKVPGSVVRSSSDPTYSAGYPTLVMSEYFVKSSGWLPLGAATLTGQEFALKSSATYAINKGASLGSPYNQLLNLSASNFTNGSFSLLDQNSYGAWEIGAGVYNGGSTDPVCGNGRVESGEQCDEGTNNGGCPKTCSTSCRLNTCGNEILKTSWSCTADSQETTAIDGRCQNAFDNIVATAWHTDWSGMSPTQPHNIDINLGATYQLSGLRYTPRQEEGTNGIVTQYEIYVSQDGTNWSDPIAAGFWSYQSKETKETSFTPAIARFVRFRSIDDNSHHWTAVAEITLLGESNVTAVPNAPGGLKLK